MKALILAAGYATRLYPLTENQPKPLLEVGGKTIIEHILMKLNNIEKVEEVLIVTNNRFYSHFIEWNNNFEYSKPIKIISDGTYSNEDRLGAVGDISFVISDQKIQDDLMVIAGDNLFHFSLTDFVQFFKEKNSSILACRDVKDPLIIKNKYGSPLLKESQLIGFEEKPEEPKSAIAATACYLFKETDLCKIDSFLADDGGDAPGNLVKWLVTHSKVHGFVFDNPWFDIGSFESLEEAEIFYSQ